MHKISPLQTILELLQDFFTLFRPGPLLTVSAGRVASAALGFLFVVLIARLLGPKDFGLFSFAFGLSAILTEVTGYGLETGLVKLVKAYSAGKRPDRAESTCRAVLGLKLMGNGGLLLFGFFALFPLEGYLLGDPAYKTPIVFALISSLGASLWRYTLAILQAREDFGTFSMVLSANNIFKIVVTGTLTFFHEMTLTTALAVHASGFFVGFLYGLFVIPQGLREYRQIEVDVWKRLIGFSKWIVASGIVSIFNYWLSSLLLGAIKSPRSLGEFSAAFNVGFLFDILLTTAKTVFFPRVCSIVEYREYINYIKDSLTLTIGISVLLSPLMIFSRPLILILYTPEYLSAAFFLQLLFPGFAATLVAELILLILFARDQPQAVFELETVRLLLHFMACLLFIPKYDALGAVIATATTRVLGSLLAILVVLRSLKTQADQG